MSAPSHLPSSGEFKLGIHRPSSNAAVIFDNNLWLIGHGDSNDLWQTTFNLGKNFNERFKNQSSWKNAQISPKGEPRRAFGAALAFQPARSRDSICFGLATSLGSMRRAAPLVTAGARPIGARPQVCSNGEPTLRLTEPRRWPRPRLAKTHSSSPPWPPAAACSLARTTQTITIITPDTGNLALLIISKSRT